MSHCSWICTAKTSAFCVCFSKTLINSSYQPRPFDRAKLFKFIDFVKYRGSLKRKVKETISIEVTFWFIQLNAIKRKSKLTCWCTVYVLKNYKEDWRKGSRVIKEHVCCDLRDAIQSIQRQADNILTVFLPTKGDVMSYLFKDLEIPRTVLKFTGTLQQPEIISHKTSLFTHHV